VRVLKNEATGGGRVHARGLEPHAGERVDLHNDVEEGGYENTSTAPEEKGESKESEQKREKKDRKNRLRAR